ncbi:hypothetical protein V8D89_006973, partial [Ganoderma adspersum]
AAPKPASTAGKAPASTASKDHLRGQRQDRDKKKREKTHKETYSSYVYNGMCFFDAHAQDNKAMAILNSFVNDIFKRIATEAS